MLHLIVVIKYQFEKVYYLFLKSNGINYPKEDFLIVNKAHRNGSYRWPSWCHYR